MVIWSSRKRKKTEKTFFIENICGTLDAEKPGKFLLPSGLARNARQTEIFTRPEVFEGCPRFLGSPALLVCSGSESVSGVSPFGRFFKGSGFFRAVWGRP
ncbi:hypothetical protein BOX30_01580 [Leptospirillum ferriphilum]|nr:hypothetical protein BOX30_01580 [Leptospirillum ferriphilum]